MKHGKSEETNPSETIVLKLHKTQTTPYINAL